MTPSSSIRTPSTRSDAPRGISPFSPRKADLKQLVALSLPVVIVQVGLVFQGVVDTLMVGRVSAPDLAAVALGNLYFFAVSVFGMGVLFSLDPIVSQAFGARDEDGVEQAIQRGLVLALILALKASVLLAVSGPLLRLLRQPADVVPLASGYTISLIAGMLPFYCFVVCRQTLQAVGRVAPIVVTMVLANLFNAGGNWLLVFGNLGFPAMGAVGSGWATSLSRWFMLVGVLVLASSTLRPYFRKIRNDVFDWAALYRIASLGTPIGLQFFLEFGAFGAIGITMGWLGTVAMAGHQVAISLAALTFMVPVGISQAGAVLVGQSVGEQDAAKARRYAGGAILLGLAVMVVSMIIFLAFADELAALYTNQAEIVVIAAMLIPVAGVFQVFDGIQVVSSGVLRGIGVTRSPMVISVLGFWLFGMPISVYLGFRTSLGPVGLWWGLAAGLAAVALLLLWRVWVRFKGPLARIGANPTV